MWGGVSVGILNTIREIDLVFVSVSFVGSLGNILVLRRVADGSRGEGEES